MQHVDTIINLVERFTGRKQRPYESTVGSLEAGLHGVHRGLYYIYPEVNFYFGKCHSPTATVFGRFYKNHGSKLRANPAELYGPPSRKVQPRIETPQGWREGVARFIYSDMPEYPEYYRKVGPRQVEPVIKENRYTPVVNIADISVLVWNMSDDPKTISDVETAVIAAIEPYCNTETYKKRLKQRLNNKTEQ